MDSPLLSFFPHPDPPPVVDRATAFRSRVSPWRPFIPPSTASISSERQNLITKMLDAAREFLAAHLVAVAVAVAVAGLLAVLLSCGEQRIPRKFGRCPEPSAESHEEEDRAARRRFTPGRLRKAVDAVGGDGVYDAIVVGSGPSGMCCAASLARLGAKVGG